MKKILFVAYGGGHINIIDLITEKLIKEKEVEFKILALTTAYNKVVAKYPDGIVKKISDYKELFRDSLSEVEEFGKELLAENYNESSGISKEDTIMYLGTSMYDLVTKYGKKKAEELYKQSKRQAFLPVETMKKILSYEKIDLIVSTTSPRFEQASFIAGNELGIETLEILDLFGELYPLPEANHIVCMNEMVKESLINQGLKDKKYHFLGQPAIENTANKILNLDKKKIRNKIQIKEKTTLLYATQIPCIYNKDFSVKSFAGYDAINKGVFEILKKINDRYDINILLRIHPNEKMINYKEQLLKYPFIKPINNILNLEESIGICDILLNQASTVSLEAMTVGKKVYTFKYFLDETFPLPAVMKRPFVFSDGFEELEKKLFEYFKNQNLKEENIEFMPKDSVKNIIKLVKELLR